MTATCRERAAEPEVSALAANAPPVPVGDQPALGLGTDGFCQLDELAGIAPAAPADRRRSHDDHAGAAAARVARRLERPFVADANGRHSAEEEVALCAGPANDAVAPLREPRPPTSDWYLPRSGASSPSRCARGARRSLRSKRQAWSTTFTIVWMIAPRRRSDPALPTTSRGRPCESRTLGAIMLVRRRPGTAAFSTPD